MEFEDWLVACRSENKTVMVYSGTLSNWVVVSDIFYFQPYLGKWSNLTNIFQMGWNHQPGKIVRVYFVCFFPFTDVDLWGVWLTVLSVKHFTIEFCSFLERGICVSDVRGCCFRIRRELQTHGDAMAFPRFVEYGIHLPWAPKTLKHKGFGHLKHQVIYHKNLLRK